MSEKQLLKDLRKLNLNMHIIDLKVTEGNGITVPTTEVSLKFPLMLGLVDIEPLLKLAEKHKAYIRIRPDEVYPNLWFEFFAIGTRTP